MTLLVPYDASDLSKAALERACEFSEYTGEDILALTVIPREPEYAKYRGWLDDSAAFDPDAIASRLEMQVHEIDPDATFRVETPEEVSSIADVTLDVVRTIRRVADEVDASIVFVGSENAGRVSAPVCSVGAPLSEDPQYDVHIVRHAS
jgi:nucleotide-binding universal stress UspA family protein